MPPRSAYSSSEAADLYLCVMYSNCIHRDSRRKDLSKAFENLPKLAHLRDAGAGLWAVRSSGRVASARLRVLFGLAQKQEVEAVRKYALLLVATAAVLALASGVALAAEAIIGTDGPDTIRGTSGDDSVLAKSGNDDVSGLGGDDSLLGQEGSDRVSGGPGTDVVSGGQGDDSAADFSRGLAGGQGNDLVKGDEGRDIVTDTAPDDKDELYGGDGRDFVNGDDGDGRDRLDCGPGVDNFIADGGDRVLANCEINGV